MEIHTERFYMRELVVNDATERYLSWLADLDASRFIETAHTATDLEKLKKYISGKLAKEDTLFLGIFTKSYEHIGNVKFEPLNFELSYAVMGILIGEEKWRGKGVAGEVLNALSKFLAEKGIQKMILGVDQNNIAAIKAYKKLGFEIVEQSYLNFKEPLKNYEMHLRYV